MTDYQRMMAETRKRNASIRAAQILERMAQQYDGTYRQVLQAYAAKEITGKFLMPLPALPERTYSATEIGKMLGCTAQRIGILANANGLKCDKYGAFFNDKAKHSSKEVQSFRYYESAVSVLRELLNTT